jgi:hypothetical protein
VTNCLLRSMPIRQMVHALEDWWRRVTMAWSFLHPARRKQLNWIINAPTHSLYVCFSVDGDTIMVEALMSLKGGRLGPNSAFSLATSLVTLAADRCWPGSRNLKRTGILDVLMSNQSVLVTHTICPVTAVPQSRISLANTLAPQPSDHVLPGETI